DAAGRVVTGLLPHVRRLHPRLARVHPPGRRALRGAPAETRLRRTLPALHGGGRTLVAQAAADPGVPERRTAVTVTAPPTPPVRMTRTVHLAVCAGGRGLRTKRPVARRRRPLAVTPGGVCGPYEHPIEFPQFKHL